MKLSLVRGICGAGKTTFAKTFKGILHVEADMFCMCDGEYCFDATKLSERHMACFKVTEMAMQCGSDCVVSNTFTTLKELDPYIRLATKYNAELKVYAMSTQYNTNIHNVPANVLENMKKRWQKYEGEIIV